ncbi:MAG: hypothetical protein JWQ38_549 [Flavipsychrobacter sp.]|nr:hypothetical protein [Flavipsychrobacter sp.]
MNKYYRLVVMLVMSVVLQFTASHAHAAFFVKKEQAIVIATIQPAKAEVHHPDKPSHIFHHPDDAAPKDDSYKGIVAAVAGSAGFASLLVALFISSVWLIFPAFILGAVGIVFGAMRKRTNKGPGLLGLILGIMDVTLVVLFIVAVIIALASFT